MAMNMGIPVAFFVSDPKLCVTSDLSQRSMWKTRELLTPRNYQSNSGICPSDNAKGSEVTNMIVAVNSEH